MRQPERLIQASLVGAGTPENPNHIPDVALSSEPATAGVHHPLDTNIGSDMEHHVWRALNGETCLTGLVER